MPAITVGLPAALTAPLPARDVACEAETVGDALRGVVDQVPQYGPRIVYGDRLLVAVTLNGALLPPAEVRGTGLSAGDRVEVVPPVAGG